MCNNSAWRTILFGPKSWGLDPQAAGIEERKVNTAAAAALETQEKTRKAAEEAKRRQRKATPTVLTGGLAGTEGVMLG